MQYSQLQEAIFDRTENTNDSISIDAYAGTGKTSTIVEDANRINPNAKATFLAFNKSIQIELESRLPSNIRAKTFHATGMGAIMYARPLATKDDFKTRNIARRFNCDPDVESAVVKLVSLGKTTASLNPDFNAIMDVYEVVVDADKVEYTVEMAASVFKESFRQKLIFDFDDMVYWPAVGDVPLYKSDVLFVDERQDMNDAQIAMIMRCMKPGGRAIVVGDIRQAIYAFRGANAEAANVLTAKLRATTLPLSICYRCGKNIIALANEIVPEIRAWDLAPDGEVHFGLVEGNKWRQMLKPNDLILCRTNAPLVSCCLKLIADGVKAQIRGRDIGKSLKALINKVTRKYICSTLNQFIGSMHAYVADESAKLIAADKIGPASLLADQSETLDALVTGIGTLEELDARIDAIFSDNVQGIMLSSIHRAKGTEADTVHIIRPDLLPHPMAKTAVQKQQEMNLKYVAITRARTILNFVSKGN